MRTSALLTLFFSFFFIIEMAFCIPLSPPAWSYASDTREIIGSQNKRIMDPVTGSIGTFLRTLGSPTLREMQLQIDDYCSKFPCPAQRGTAEI
ncbi:hypothetical protein BD769DRAFT_1441180 [Suillus cothurnatus]|jgi:hypothetical protein|nr:hypothetical protein BD769DRAFT_1441180 [Suillus cothurnatus]